MNRLVSSYAATLVAGILLGGSGVLWWQRPAQGVADPTGRVATVDRAELRGKDVSPLLPSPVVAPIVERQRREGRKVQAVAQYWADVDPSDVKTPIEAIATLSTDSKGQPAATIDVFRVDFGGQRIPLPNAHTLSVATQPQKPRWHLTFAVQAGVGLGPTGAVGVQWLRKGTSTAAEHSRYALLSPAVVVDKTGVKALGVMPVSVNLGNLPYVPLFKDLWVSPFVGRTPAAKPHYSLLLTASF